VTGRSPGLARRALIHHPGLLSRPPEQIDQPAANENSLQCDDREQAYPVSASPSALNTDATVHTIDTDGDWRKPPLVNVAVACAAHGPRGTTEEDPADRSGTERQSKRHRQQKEHAAMMASLWRFVGVVAAL
jgi:hypothetical protein